MARPKSCELLTELSLAGECRRRDCHVVELRPERQRYDRRARLGCAGMLGFGALGVRVWTTWRKRKRPTIIDCRLSGRATVLRLP